MVAEFELSKWGMPLDRKAFDEGVEAKIAEMKNEDRVGFNEPIDDRFILLDGKRRVAISRYGPVYGFRDDEHWLEFAKRYGQDRAFNANDMIGCGWITPQQYEQWEGKPITEDGIVAARDALMNSGGDLGAGGLL